MHADAMAEASQDDPEELFSTFSLPPVSERLLINRLGDYLLHHETLGGKVS